MNLKAGLRRGLGALLALGGLFAPMRAHAQGTLCAEVKLEILQEATLEREAFDARLVVNNNLPDKPLTSLRVQVFLKDADGNTSDSAFFVKLGTMTGTNAVDGTGVIQSSSSAEIRWLIIPSPGAGGSLPQGKRYGVSAMITALSGTEPQTVQTFEDLITVYPQPLLKLEYVLPYEVFSDEPLTGLIEPVEPFPLGVRVTNVGFGTAKNFKIDSAQPKITENKQGLLIDFKLLGTVVGGKTIADTLLVPFGDVPPNGVGQASWIMSTSLSGRFVEFTSTFTHAAELGGALTSLLQSVTTYTLLKDVLVDLPGRDATPDFLVNASYSRTEMQALLDSGGVPPGELILESDQPQPLPVVELPGRVEGALGGSAASLTFSFDQAVGANVWAHSSVPFPLGTGIKLVSVQRADGKALSLGNVWVSKHFRKSDLAVLYRLNLLDLTSAATSYTLNFDPAGVDLPPGAVGDLAAATGALGGEVALSWTAPGEDGYAGSILGGRYLIQHEEDAGAAFNPNSAQINFTTSTTAGRMEAYAARGLVGNATHYLHLWTQDTGGGVSGLSNGATAYALPNPPRDMVLTAVGSNTAAVEWQVGNNRLPIEYQVRADTDAAAPFAAESPFFDSFSRSFVFAGLSPNTTYLFYGTARNTETLVTSELSTLGNTITLAAAPQARPAISISTGSLVVVWDASGNPGETEYYAELSTAPSHDPVLAASGWTAQTSFSFAGLAAETTYYAQVKARNLALIETAFADLGAVRTAPGDSLPPRTSLVAGAPSFGAEPVFVSSLTLLGFSAVDDLTAVEDGVGFGVARTSYSVDGGSFAVFAASFSLAGEGLHEVRYFSVDVEGHEEGVVTSTVAVDDPFRAGGNGRGGRRWGGGACGEASHEPGGAKLGGVFGAHL